MCVTFASDGFRMCNKAFFFLLLFTRSLCTLIPIYVLNYASAMAVFVLPGAAVAGIVVGVVIIFLLGGFAAWFLYKRYLKVAHLPERVSMEPDEVIKM